MNPLDRAMKWAVEYHAGQTDRAGVPYIAHICAVVAGVETEDEKTVAALHDVVEDTEIHMGDVYFAFPRQIAEAVDAITKRDKEPYKEYLARVKANELARKVKIADLRHNMDLRRLPEVTEKDLARHAKYLEALAFLLDGEGNA